jgi:vacuolar-type H+-ATPase subunit H
MELIRQIKAAEAQAKQLVDQGRTDANRMLESARQCTAEQTATAQQQRREAIERATEAGRQQGQAQADRLMAEGRQRIQALGQRCKGKIDACSQSVIEAVRNLPA